MAQAGSLLRSGLFYHLTVIVSAPVSSARTAASLRTPASAWLGFDPRTLQIDTSLVVDFVNSDFHFIADVHDIFYIFHPVVSHFGNMQQSFLARQDFDKGSEGHNPARFWRIPYPARR